MQFYSSIHQIPELAGLSPEQAKQAWQFCYWKYAFKNWQSLACLFAVGVLAVIGSKFFGPVLGAAIGGAIGGALFWFVTANVLRPHLRNYVSHHFAPTSPSAEVAPHDSSN
ncbi:hypothetical protein [Pseudanabaena sp. PCC 6802]|uniref:hypothetical protein n=1 Tax=Pseudanabaena sp. PCC 6802 TaxID=118173 RepID=UPI000346BD3F|nr:hypothetical protein [Pseudanabaena sp. PCC 6802]